MLLQGGSLHRTHPGVLPLRATLSRDTLGLEARCRCRRSCFFVRADFSQGKSGSRGFFGKQKKESDAEEAARKSLESMFKGKKDVLASFDTSAGGGSGNKGGGKKGLGGDGSGGGKNWQPPDWRGLSGKFGRGASSAMKAVLAILTFAGVLFVLPMLPYVSGMVIKILKMTLRLDGRSSSAGRHKEIDPVAFAGTSSLGTYETAVIRKYGGDTD